MIYIERRHKSKLITNMLMSLKNAFIKRVVNKKGEDTNSDYFQKFVIKSMFI